MLFELLFEDYLEIIGSRDLLQPDKLQDDNTWSRLYLTTFTATNLEQHYLLVNSLFLKSQVYVSYKSTKTASSLPSIAPRHCQVCSITWSYTNNRNGIERMHWNRKTPSYIQSIFFKIGWVAILIWWSKKLDPHSSHRTCSRRDVSGTTIAQDQEERYISSPILFLRKPMHRHATYQKSLSRFSIFGLFL